MLKRILQIISDVLSCKVEELNENSDIKNAANWDSLNHLKVLISICEYFNLEFDSLPYAELTSVRKILLYLKEKGMKEKISSMAIVMAGDRKILLLNSEGEWVFPKGHVEQGETYLETAIRELQEESGVVVKEEDSIGQVDEFSFYFDKEDALKVIKVFGFKIKEAQKITYKEDECFIDGQWIDVDKVDAMLKHDDAKNAFKKFMEKANG